VWEYKLVRGISVSVEITKKEAGAGGVCRVMGWVRVHLLGVSVKEQGRIWCQNEVVFVYYESIKRELKRRPIYECRCDES